MLSCMSLQSSCVKWRGGSLVFGSKDIPALLTLTEEETLVATCKYQTSIEAVKG